MPPTTKTCVVCLKRLADRRPLLFQGDDLIHAACAGVAPAQSVAPPQGGPPSERRKPRAA